MMDSNEVTIVDVSGGYRQILTDIMEELKSEEVPLLKKSAQGEGTQVLNENTDEEHFKLFIYLGALLAFSFLTMQPFSIDLEEAVWKQIFGHKLDQNDLEKFDQTAAYNLLDYSESADAKLNEIKVQNYFAKFSKQVSKIRLGMDTVLDGKLDTFAYLPLGEIEHRICGRPTYQID